MSDRLEQLRKVSYVPHPSFLRWNEVEEVDLPFIPTYDFSESWDKSKNPHIVLTPEEEKYSFLLYNYLRYRLKSYSHLTRLTSKQEDTVEQLWHRMQKMENDLVNANTGLVVDIVKKVSRRHKEGKATLERFEELINFGMYQLFRLIRRFDVSKGFKFSTYASRGIFTRIKSEEQIQFLRQARFRKFENPRDKDGGFRSQISTIEDRVENTEICQRVLGVIESKILDIREKKIIMSRFFGDEKKTLKDIGRSLGVTQERTRQLQTQALGKLRVEFENRGLTEEICTLQ